MVSFFGITRLGKRAKNEDYFDIWNKDGRYLFAVADGLGGHKKGEVASKTVVKTSMAVAEYEASDANILDSCFNEGQKLLLQEQKKHHMENDMKTTEVILYINGNTARWGHVGDSRLYRFKTGLFSKMAERTIDHSAVQNLVLMGRMKEKDIRGSEDRNKLLRAMGMEWDSPKQTLSPEHRLEKNDSFLLCTDGFWEQITEKEMLACLKRSATPEQWLRLMEDIILRNIERTGKSDNYTAVAVFSR
ncbi:MAG: protein phosphatase 2C domain-containing protein [Clostridiales bacterium]|nr:protein phosphatase 2C domain-containing protein [Clostridiales bacterium]